MKNIFYFLFITTATLGLYDSAHAQVFPATIQWEKSYGGTGWDYICTMVQTPDSGFITAGSSNSTDGDVTGNHGGLDIWIVKTDKTGNIQWSKSYGGSQNDIVIRIANGLTGGFIFSGMTSSSDGTISGTYHGNGDAWVVKIDDTGRIQWQKVLGGSLTDFANNIMPTHDNAYLMVGGTASNNGDILSNAGGHDVWLVKLDSNGNTIWSKTYGGTLYEVGFNSICTFTGDYMISCGTTSTDGLVTGNHGGEDWWILKIDTAGNLLSQKTYGGSLSDIPGSLSQTSDSGFIISGMTGSLNGDVTQNKGLEDFWIVKTDKTGNIQWQKTYGGTGTDRAHTVQIVGDSSYIVIGRSNSHDSDVTGNHGATDFWVIKINNVGNLIWEKSFGGSTSDSGNYLITTFDGAYCIAGNTVSNDGDVTGNHGGTDSWLVKLYPDSVIGTNVQKVKVANQDILVYPTVSQGKIDVIMPKGFENAKIIIISTATGKDLRINGDNFGLQRTLYLNNIAPGYYIMKIINGDEISNYKVIIEK